MKVLYLFNNPIATTVANVERGVGHDNHLYGMLRLRADGIETDYLEIEKYLPARVAVFLRKHILTMHYAHLPLFPLFFRYDVVLTSTAYSSLILKALFRIKSFKWVILDFNILGTIGEEKTLRQKIFAWAVSRADGIVAISEAEAGALKERFPHLREQIVFFHEATDTEYFKPQKDVEEKDIVLSVGNYGRDFDTVIKATEGLGVECRLATKLISPVKALELPAHVTVGLYTHEEMQRNYAEAKVVFVGIAKKDDYYDSVGTFAVIEALAMGKATIATHTRNMGSYIKHEVTGVLVPQFDIDALRAQAGALLSDTKKRAGLGEKARAWAKAHVAPDTFARNLSGYLNKLCL